MAVDGQDLRIQVIFCFRYDWYDLYQPHLISTRNDVTFLVGEPFYGQNNQQQDPSCEIWSSHRPLFVGWFGALSELNSMRLWILHPKSCLRIHFYTQVYIYIVCFIMQTYKYVSDIYLDMKLYVTTSFVCPETCLLSPCLMKKSCRQGRFRTQEPKTWGRELSVDGKLCQRALLQTNLP